MEEIKLSKKTTIKILIVTIAFFMVAVVGVSYAYFGWQFLGNDEASSLTLLSKELKLRYTDTSLIMGSNEFPGWSQTKTITVENYGNGEVLYNFVWKTLYNTVQKGDLVIRATCSSNKGSCDNLPEKEIIYAPNEVTNSYIHGPFTIDTGEIQTYTLTLEYKETGSNQSYNNGASFHGTINISEGAEEHPLYGVLRTLAQQGTYASTYSGEHNDSYGRVGTKPIYYVRTKTANNPTQAATILNSNTDIISGSGIRGINVKFAGYCWQILRTTDTGGVKLIYNGEYVNGTGCKAQDTADTHKGIIGTTGASGGMIGNYMYSDTFTYNTSTNQFTLVNPTVSNWSTNKDLLGKYTCKTNSSTSTCSTLYYLNMKSGTNANNAWYTSYTIGNTQNAQIGASPINANYNSPAYVGYMFGDTAYEYVGSTAPTSGVKMGNDVYWDGSNYVLKDGDNDSTQTYSGSQNANYHYTCNTTSTTCTDGKVRYYYYGNYYTELTGGDKIEDAISKMLTNVENKHDSAMKAYLENWYYNNLKDYEDYIDQDAVYCNDRSIISLGGWSKTGSLATGAAAYLQFNNYNTITTLGCANNLDKFSTSNTNAQLKYPIGLATAPEMNLISNSNVRKTGQNNWLVSPRYFGNSDANERFVYSNGSMNYSNVINTRGGRPVITLAPANYTVTGSGSLSDPYIVGE